MSSNIKTVGVVGTGVIGASWTALFLARGLKVLVSDPASGADQRLSDNVKKIWPSLEELGLSSGASIDNYRFVGPSLQDHYADVDFIQENAPEKLELKAKIIGEIDAGARSDVVIASSSSGIPTSQSIGKCVNNPGRVLIGHPFSPPHLFPLVEVVPHPGGSEEATDMALDFYKSVGKRPVLVKQEAPGFAANRLQAAVCSEAYSLVKRGILSAADIDACITTSLGPRWALTGPFMSNVLGGGGGRGGFKQILGHLGPAMEGWLKDMSAHKYEFSEANLEILDKSVQEELDRFDVGNVEKQRDHLLINLLKDKSSASAIV